MRACTKKGITSSHCSFIFISAFSNDTSLLLGLLTLKCLENELIPGMDPDLKFGSGKASLHKFQLF